MTAVTVGSGRKNSLAVGALLRYAVAAAAAACCVSGCGPADDGAQCTALGQLFHATGGPQWQRNAGWLKPRVSYCSWAGVTCDLKNFEQKRYNVVALNLSKNSLNGTLGPFIAAFPSLTELNLWSNELGGSLPDSLRNLRQLRDLNVYDNLLSGTIPPQLGLMGALVGVRAAHNRLSGTIPNLGGLLNLEALHLFNNQLVGSIPESLGHLPRLQQMDLANNGLSGSVPSSLCTFVHRVAANISKSAMTCNLKAMNFSCPLPCGMGAALCDATCRNAR